MKYTYLIVYLFLTYLECSLQSSVQMFDLKFACDKLQKPDPPSLQCVWHLTNDITKYTVCKCCTFTTMDKSVGMIRNFFPFFAFPLLNVEIPNLLHRQSLSMKGSTSTFFIVCWVSVPTNFDHGSYRLNK